MASKFWKGSLRSMTGQSLRVTWKKWAVMRNHPHPSSCNHYFTVSINLTTVGTSYKWNHTVSVLLWLALFFTYHNVLKVHACCSKCLNFTLLKAEYYFHCMYINYCLLTDSWVASTFGYCECCCYEHGCTTCLIFLTFYFEIMID